MQRKISSISQIVVTLFLGVIPGTALACPENDTNCYWILALDASRDLDETGFFAAVEGARAALAMSPAPTPQERAAVARLEGIKAVLQGDELAARRDFEEARRLDPEAVLPGDLYPPDHLIARLYAAAGPPGPPRLVAVAPTAEPSQNTAIVNPVTTTQSEIQAPRRDLRLPLLGGAVVSGLLSGGLLALAAAVPEVEAQPGQDPFDYQHAEGVALSRGYALKTASGGAALVGAGLLTVGLTVRW